MNWRGVRNARVSSQVVGHCGQVLSAGPTMEDLDLYRAGGAGIEQEIFIRNRVTF